MIDTSMWKDFRVGDLFDVIKGTRLTKADMKDGSIKFVGSSAMNNGETHRIANNEHLHPANTITVCYNGSVGETFYQDEEFWASDDVNVLYSKFNMTKNVALFICPIIKSVGQKYAFVDKWKQEDMKSSIIKLPITLDGQPDWAYMESYMKSIMEESEKRLENLKKTDDTKHLIDVSGWGEFRVGDLFDIHPTNAYKVTNVELIDDNGRNPVVANSGFNNGIIGFTNYECNENAGVITFTDTAAKSSESFFYQADNFVGYPHVQGMYCKSHNLNTYEGKFITTVLRSAAGKFDFIIKMTRDEVKEFVIKLPITLTGEPDWQYMEDYMKAIMDKSEQTISDLQKL